LLRSFCTFFPEQSGKNYLQVAAAMSGDSQAFSLAVQNGIDSPDAQGNTALIAAAFAGNDPLALQLIGAKADISKQNDTGCDATWVAAAYGKADVLKTLLGAGGSALTCNKQVLSGPAASLYRPHPPPPRTIPLSHSFAGG
jgi:ankyrin repeat protein